MALRSTALSGTKFSVCCVFNELRASDLWLCSQIMTANLCTKSDELFKKQERSVLASVRIHCTGTVSNTAALIRSTCGP